MGVDEEVRGQHATRFEVLLPHLNERQQRLARLEVRIRQMSELPSHGAYDVIVRDVEPELVATCREVGGQHYASHLGRGSRAPPRLTLRPIRQVIR